MDAEKLLFLIEERPQIYNYNDKDYSNKILIQKLWEEIATEMNCEVSECKSKWTNLRNSYTRYLREDKNKPSGSCSKKKKKWYLVDAMSFLKDYVNQHPNTRSSSYNQNSIGDEDETQNVHSPNILNESTQSNTSSASDSPIKPKRAKTFVTEMVAGPMIELLPSRTKEKTSENGNTLFFKSMLADYEKLSSRGQRAFRSYMLNKMNELQEEEESLLMASANETSNVKYNFPNQHTYYTNKSYHN